LVKAPFAFEFSIALLFAIIVGLILMVSIWVVEELIPQTQERASGPSLAPL